MVADYIETIGMRLFSSGFILPYNPTRRIGKIPRSAARMSERIISSL